MAKRKNRNETERELQLAKVADMYLHERPAPEIARELKIDRSQVYYDLKVIRERWKQNTSINIDEEKCRALMKIDKLEETYWDAWQLSLGQRKSTTAERADGGKSRTSLKAEDVLGDPRYLAGIQWCITERCKILGIYAPTKVAPTDPSGKNEYSGFTEDQRLTAVVALLDIARARRAGQSS
jgi:hypothetical protein